MNNKKFKAGILIAVLAVPAFVFIFLKVFAENKFDLPYFFPELEESGQAKIIKGDTVWSKAPVFKLINQDGNQYTNTDSTIKVVSFFFSRCTTICPPTNKNLERIQETFKNEPKVSIISISIDPNNDKDSVLKSFATKFNAINNKWQFLTGDKAYIYDLGIKGFKLPIADASEYNKEIKSVDETFIHSDKLLLVDSKGYFRGIYSSTDKFEIDRLKAEIKVLLSQ